MKLAVIKTGGKQYIVSPKQTIQIEKLDKAEGEEVIFDEILLVADTDAKKVIIGQPKVEDIKIKGIIKKQGKDKKIIVFKYKAKKRYKVKRGHRQSYSLVEINDFNFKKTS